MSRRPADGKGALFAPGPAAAAPAGPGKRGLFSRPVTGSGPVTATCADCRSARRMWPVELVVRHFPVPLWLPRGPYDHRLRCDPCGRHTWHSVRWGRP